MTPFDAVATHGLARGAALAAVDLESGRRWSWVEFDCACSRAANWLVEALGPASGARVATLSRNCVEMLILQIACVRAGAIFVPFNWRLAAAELEALVADATPVMLFHDHDFSVPDFVGINHPIDSLETLTATSSAQNPVGARRDMHAPTTLLYTSGTSGRPKGVMLSEANAFWGCTNFIHGNRVSSDSVFLCDMPLFHTAGLFAASRTPLLSGGTVLVSGGFDPARTLARIADPALGITHYFSVPQMAQMLWNQPGFAPEMLQRLHVYATGGAPNPKAQIERFIGADIAMSDGFGMSETGSNFAMPIDDKARLVAKAGSCGLPLLAVETRIVDDDDTDVPDGETGELWLRGPSIASGYWNQPELSAAAFHDGWFKTGDAAVRDADGFFFLVDRKKDMYISGGENVYPAEVERVIAELACVAEVAVIGIADERWGEVGQAHIIAVAGQSVTPEMIVTHCKAQLASFKVPKSVVMAATIPRTASGKVQKHLLKIQN
jgi:fatty-acyl-CoA synthase